METSRCGRRRVRRSHIVKPTNFRPSRTPSEKCSSASASLPGRVFLSDAEMIFTTTASSTYAGDT